MKAKHKRILILNDNTQLLKLFDEALTAHGYSVETAIDGGLALGLMDNIHFDLVISDVFMHNMNGIELLVSMKKRKSQIPVIMMSDVADDVMLDKSMTHGSITFMKKPIDIDVLCTLADDTISSNPTKTVEFRILIIDDNPNVREILSDVFGSAGYFVAATENGIKALEEIARHEKPFDYAMVDIHMPGMGGIEFLGKLKEASPSTLPIIMTGDAVSTEIREAYAEGGYSLIRKPFDIQNLVHYFSQLHSESNDRKKELRRQERHNRLPFHRKAYAFLRDKVIFAPRMSKAKRTINMIGLIIIFAVIVLVLLQLMIFTEKLMSDGTSRIDSFIDNVMGYLQRDEERETKKERPGPF